MPLTKETHVAWTTSQGKKRGNGKKAGGFELDGNTRRASGDGLLGAVQWDKTGAFSAYKAPALTEEK